MGPRFFEAVIVLFHEPRGAPGAMQGNGDNRSGQRAACEAREDRGGEEKSWNGPANDDEESASRGQSFAVAARGREIDFPTFPISILLLARSVSFRFGGAGKGKVASPAVFQGHDSPTSLDTITASAKGLLLLLVVVVAVRDDAGWRGNSRRRFDPTEVLLACTHRTANCQQRVCVRKKATDGGTFLPWADERADFSQRNDGRSVSSVAAANTQCVSLGERRHACAWIM